MDYKASLDSAAQINTLVAIILFIFLGYLSIKTLLASQGDVTSILMHCGILLILLGILLGSYLYAPQSYQVDNTYLTIVRPINNKKIKLIDIVEIRTINDSEMTGIIRTFGVGGVFGYYGKYYNSKMGSMTFYATKRGNRIIVRTKNDEKIIITPDNQTILGELKEKVSTIL